MRPLKRFFEENWGYLVFPLVVILGLVWAVGAVGGIAYGVATAALSFLQR